MVFSRSIGLFCYAVPLNNKYGLVWTRMDCNAVGLPYDAVTLPSIPSLLFCLQASKAGNRTVIDLFD
jgi:hypothetical protein